jgi:hypothetical protein
MQVQSGIPKVPMIEAEPSIDEYLRKRLMPVEGAIPHLDGIEMFGNSIPAGKVGGDLFEYINFQQRYNIDARIAGVHSNSPRSIWNLFQKEQRQVMKSIFMCIGWSPEQALPWPMRSNTEKPRVLSS